MHKTIQNLLNIESKIKLRNITSKLRKGKGNKTRRRTRNKKTTKGKKK